ncbi:MAG: ArsR family transcriptional regulator [Candidatus Heimdallarchaeota archaeon]|nr:ArsR family transcriptional regulator [Candidatus Heimdallarchaeota archaeon]MBY8992957.1 ArsR family transcriptional regulator [Candidatus Heimdallarchaeota archaeon]
MHKKRKLVIWVFFFLITTTISICASWLIYKYLIFTPINKKILYVVLAGAVLLVLASFVGSLNSSVTYDNVLGNFNRARIYHLIQEKPGIHFSEIVRSLELSRGQTQWHLIWLERFDMIKRIKTKQFLLFYLNDGSFSEELSEITHTIVLKSETRNLILNIIRDEPGITQMKIKKKVQKSQSTITYHLVILEQEDFIAIQRKGWRRYYFPISNAAS